MWTGRLDDPDRAGTPRPSLDCAARLKLREEPMHRGFRWRPQGRLKFRNTWHGAVARVMRPDRVEAGLLSRSEAGFGRHFLVLVMF